MFQDFYKKFINSKEYSKFPIITSSIITLAATFVPFRKTNILSKLRSGSKSFFNKDDIPTIPKTSNKPVLVFDFRDFLVKSKFSFSHFDYSFYKRPFSEEFIFNLFPNYELINISDAQSDECLNTISKIDHYGFISYRLFVNNKKNIFQNHLNRDLNKLIILSTTKNEYNPVFDNNILLCNKWNGKYDTLLFDLSVFLNNISNLKNFKPLIKSYKSTDFESEFKDVLKTNFIQNNLFSFKVFENEMEIERKKIIEEYKKLKVKFKKQKNYKKIIFDLIKNLFL